MKAAYSSILMAMFLLGLAGCSDSRPAAAAPPGGGPGAVQAAAPVARAPESGFVASGPIVVENQVDVSALREGVVAQIMSEPGAIVKRGQMLATLDDRQISAELEAARARTRSADADLRNWEAEAKVLESDYQRAQKMWDAQLITREQLDHARYKAESDQWDIRRVQEVVKTDKATELALELELEKTRIRAPFDGVVARRYVRAGQKVALGERLFWVSATAPLQVKFTLPERFLGQLKNGQEVTVTSSDLPSDRHTARIIHFSPVIDPSSGTIDVLAQITGGPGALRPGMTAEVRLQDTR